MTCKLIGYHGTTKENAKKIIKDNRFLKSNSEEEWIGPGIYFYDNIENAYEYNMRNYNYFNMDYKKFISETNILKANIECDEENILNLNNFEDKYRFILFYRMVKDYIKNNNRFKNSDFQDGFILKYLLEKTDLMSGCQVITNIFSRTFRKANKEFSSRFAYEIKQLYINVIDEKCIVSIENVNNSNKQLFNMINDIYYNIKEEDEENEI